MANPWDIDWDGGAHSGALPKIVQTIETGGMRDPDHAVSPKGALGRNQIMPDTARQYGFDPAQLSDPAYNNRVRDHIINDLSNRFGGDQDAVLVGYNAGPGRVAKWNANGRNPAYLPVETQNYLAKAHTMQGDQPAQADPFAAPVIEPPAEEAPADAGALPPWQQNWGGGGDKRTGDQKPDALPWNKTWEKPAPAKPGVLDTVTDAFAGGQNPTALGAGARGVVRGALPAAGGVAGFGAGMAAGAGLGALTGPAAPIAVPVLGFAGGMAGAFGAGDIASKTQEAILHRFPALARILGQDEAQRRADAEKHPYASFAGELAPNLAAFRPGKLANIPEDAKLIERLMGHPVAARGVPAALMGSQEAGTEYAQDGHVDPAKVAMSAALGAVSNRETALGHKLLRAGAAPVEATAGAIARAARGFRGAPAAEAAVEQTAPQPQPEAQPAPPAPDGIPTPDNALTPVHDPATWAQTGWKDAAGNVLPLDAKTAAAAPAPDAGIVPDQFEPAAHAAEADIRPGVQPEPTPGIAPDIAMKALETNIDPATGERPKGNAAIRALREKMAAILLAGGKSVEQNVAHETPQAKPKDEGAAMQPVSEPAGNGAKVLPSVQGGLRQGMAEKASAVRNPEVADLGQGKGPESPKDGADNKTALPLRGESGDAPRKLQQAAGGDVALPEVSSGAPQGQAGSGESGQEGGTRPQAGGNSGQNPSGKPVKFDPAEHYNAAMELVRDPKANLTTASIAQHLGVKPVQAARVAAMLASRPDTGVTLSRSGNLRRKAVSNQPNDAAGYLASKGGIKDSEGHDLIKGRGLQQFVPGHGPLIRPKGMSIDAAGEALHEAGFFGPPEATPRPTENEVLQLLERTGRGASGKATKVRSDTDQAGLDAQAEAAKATDDNARAEADIADHGKQLGETFSKEDTAAIMGIMGERGLNAEDAVHDYVERLAMKDAHDVAEEAQDDAYADIPFDTEPAQAQPAEDGRAAGERGTGRPGEQQDAGAGRPVSEAAAESPRQEEPAAGAVTKFTTAKGSTYEVHPDGTTTRNKAARPDPGHEGQQGPQPRSQRTFYVTKEHADELGLFQTQGGPRMAVEERPDGTAGVKYLDGKDAGKFEKRTVAKVSKEPAPGLTPVETWKDGTSVHFGNEITSVGDKPLSTEKGADGKDQTIVPGAEASARQLAQAREDSGHGKIKPKAQQKDAGGLFEDKSQQTADMLAEAPPADKPAAKPEAAKPEAAKEPKPAKAKEPDDIIQDAGEKIGGARKDQWAERGLRASDLEGMSEGEAYQHVTKDAVWPKPDYAKMVEGGMDPLVAAQVKIIRDRLAAKPRTDSAQGRRDYVEMMGHIREELESVKSKADMAGASAKIIHDRLGWERAHQGMRSMDASKEIRDRLFSVFNGRHETLGVQYGDERKAQKMLDAGFPGDIAPWTRRMEVRQSGDGFFITEKGKWRTLEKGFATKADAEKRAAALYEEKKGTGEDAPLPSRPHLDKLERTGMDIRGGKNADSKDFVDDFGFRGVEFGNWVAGDERQKSTNLAYDGLHDLAETLGIPPKALSLDGKLGLAFGARGSGGAAAHYEPGKLVINLTKMSGAGSLAHEWGHALDHYFGILDRPESSKGQPIYASGRHERVPHHAWERHLPNVRPEMREAFYKLMDSMFRKDKPRAMAVRDVEQVLETNEAQLEKYQKQLDDHIKRPPAEQQKSWVKQTRTWLEGQGARVKMLKGKLEELRDDSKPYNPSKTQTSYDKSALGLSGKSGEKGYWARPTEMLARSFESYVFDKIKEKGGRSDYLVQGVEGDRHAGHPKGNPYPAGEERDAINAAYDNLFKEMKVRDSAKGGKELYSKRDDAPVQTDTPEFKKWFGDSQIVDDAGQPRVMYHVGNPDIEAFRGMPTSSHLIYFNESEVGARDGARNKAQTYPVYLKVETPFGSPDRPLPWHEAEARAEKIKSDGYDGIYVKDEGGISLAVFDGKQIKSATDNRGTFDPNDPRINYSQAGGNAPIEAGRRANGGRVRRGAEAVINRLRMQVNLDRARARAEGRGGAATDHAEVREVEDFVEFIGRHMFNDVGLSIRADQGPMGSFNTGSRIVTIFRKALERGELPRTAVHELWHHLDDAISDADWEATHREFQSVRDKWLKKNPWYEPFVAGDGEMQNRLTGKEADDWVSQYGKRLDSGEWTGDKKRIPMNVGQDDRGRTMVSFPWDHETYRFTNRDEYFAESLSDKYFDYREMQDEKARSLVGWARDIWSRMVSGIKRVFGGDSTGRIFDGFRDGDYATPMPHGDARDLEMRRGDPADDEPPKERPPGPINRLLGEHTNDFFKKIGTSVDRVMPETLKDAGEALQMTFTPMAAGSATPEARAAAKDFANAMRKARLIGGRQVDYLAKNFEPEQLQKMWESGDQESVMRQQGQEPGPTQGLDRLTPAERTTVEAYQADSNVLLEQAKEIGLFKGEGLPSYVPRMVVAMGADGKVGRLGHGGETAHGLDAIGKNLKTTSANLRQRKHMTVEETERAAQALDPNAVVIKDIRTLPIAMTRLQEAIAGRRLINKIREMGRDSGELTIAEGYDPSTATKEKWFTLDHPAFKSYRPQLVKNEETGRHEILKDAEGNDLFEKVPLYVRGDFEGPLRAVLSQDQGRIYKAFMDIKGKMMSVIMYSPLMHNAVIWGKAFPVSPLKMLNPAWRDADGKWHFSLELYGRGHALKNDPETMKEALDNGMDPIGHRFFNQDLSSLMEVPDIKPGRSWTAQAVGAIPSLFSKEAGDKVKRAIDKAGDVWHNKFLWDRVGDLQMGIYSQLKDKAIKDGMDPQTAGRYAAHFANRYGGALPIESMSQMSRAIANMLLFSRSFTMTNLGAFKDISLGLPRDVQAQIMRDKGIQALNRAQGTTRRKAIAMLVLDIALAHFGTVLAQHAAAYLLGIPYRSPSENEPDKDTRFLMGHEPDGTAIYGRLPTGKVSEDWQNWVESPAKTGQNKLSPYGHIMYGAMSNDQGFGRKIYDPYDHSIGGYFKNAAKLGIYAARQIVPIDAAASLAGRAIGKDARSAIAPALAGYGIYLGNNSQKGGTAKAVLPFLGITVSHGAPGGEGAGQLFSSKDEHEYQVNQQMPAIRSMIRDGNIKGASEEMTKLGIPRGLQKYQIKVTLNPGARLSKKQMRDFMGYATDEDKKRMRQFMDRTKQDDEEEDNGAPSDQHSALEPQDLKSVIGSHEKLASAASSGLSWTPGQAAAAMKDAGYPATAELLRASRPLRPELRQKLLGDSGFG